MSIVEARLGDIAQIERVTVAPTEVRNGETYVGLENVTKDGDFVGVAPVTNGALKSAKFRFDQGHVLYGKLRPYLAKIAAPEFSGVCSTDILPIRPGSNVDRRYLLHFLRTPVMIGHASRLAVGINLPRLSPSSLADFLIPLPPIEEQRRIAAVLDTAEALRAKRRQALAKLDTLTRAAFIHLFGHPLSDAQAWSRVALGEAGWVQTGKTPPGSVAGMFGADVPFITPGDLESSAPVQRWLSTKGAARVRVVDEGATLVCCIGATIGKVGETSQPSAFNQQINAIVWDPSMVAPSYGTQVLRLMSREVARLGASTTMPILKKSSFERMTIPVPPLDTQERFASVRASVVARRAEMIPQEQRLDVLFASLQQRTF